MKIILNGDLREVPDAITAADLINELELVGQRLAMEINREIVPRSAFDTWQLRPQDQVEIVRAIGGG